MSNSENIHSVCRFVCSINHTHKGFTGFVYLCTSLTLALLLWWKSEFLVMSIQRHTDSTSNWQNQKGEVHKTWLKEYECFWCHWKSLPTCAHNQVVWSLCTSVSTLEACCVTSITAPPKMMCHKNLCQILPNRTTWSISMDEWNKLSKWDARFCITTVFSREGRILKQTTLTYVSVFKFSMYLILSPEKCWEPMTPIE